MGPGLEQFKASVAEFSYAVDAPQLAEDINVDITLYRIKDDVEENFQL